MSNTARIAKKHPYALLPANPDYVGKPVHGTGGAGNTGGGGLRDLQFYKESLRC